MSVLDNLPHTCTAQRRTRTQGTLGGAKDSWSTVLFSGRACWRQPAGDNESDYAMKRGISVSHKVYFTSDPGVDERDRLVFSDGNYLVRTLPHPDASVGRGVVWRVMVDDSNK
jgi:hypothetical protein